MQQLIMRVELAYIDISASGFWVGKHQKEFFNVKVNAINAPSYHGTQVSSLYQCFECEKQQKYEQYIREIEMGSFTPVVFSTLRGGMGHAAQCCVLQQTCFPCLSSEGVVV